VDGRLKVRDSFTHGNRCYLLLEAMTGGAGAPPPPSKQTALRSVLTAGGLKVPALELGRTASTVLLHSRAVLEFMGLSCAPSKTPALVMLAAYCAHGLRIEHDGRYTELSEGDARYAVASVTRPDAAAGRLLSPALREVLRMVVDGMTHAEIARARGTSHRTVANQLSAIFHRLGVSGRLELMRHLATASAFPCGAQRISA
jgi:DNA-binding CsgD family transcriptional regulator